MNEIEHGWKQSESHPPEKWIELSGLSGIVSAPELTAFLGAGPATANQYARSLLALHELGGASDDDARKAAAKAKAARQTEEARKAEAARRAEEARKAETARRAEKDRRLHRIALAFWVVAFITVGLLPVLVKTGRQADFGRSVDARLPQDPSATATNRAANGNSASRVIDDTPPRVLSIRLSPNRQRTGSNVIWHVTFSEPVRNVSPNGADFRISGADAAITVRQVGNVGRMYVVIASVVDLGRSNGTIMLSFGASQDIKDAGGNALTDTTPIHANDNTLLVDNTAPRVIIDPANSTTPGEADDGAASGEEHGSTPSREDEDGTAPRRDDGNASAAAEPAADAADRTYPRIRSLVRQDPSAYRTNADSLTWRITFTEAVTNIDRRDFVIIGIRPWRLTVTAVRESGNVYDITLDSRGLAGLNGTVTLAISPGMYIKNLTGNSLLNVNADGRYEASFVIDNAAPSVIFDSVSLPANRVTDLAGNGNTASTSYDGSYGTDTTDPRLISIVRQAPRARLPAPTRSRGA